MQEQGKQQVWIEYKAGAIYIRYQLSDGNYRVTCSPLKGQAPVAKTINYEGWNK